jgi:hypothetical protein
MVYSFISATFFLCKVIVMVSEVVSLFLECLTCEDDTKRLSQNGGTNYQSMQHNIPEE